MITEQQDIYFIEGNPQKGYKTQYASKIGVILPPNPGRGENEPTFIMNMLPQRQGKMVVIPKGQKPGETNPQQGFAPNAYQQASQSTGGGYPQHGNNAPAPTGPNDYGTTSGQHPYAPGNTNY